jgi:shikimate kinase
MSDTRNIVLVGFMGSGKSSTGRYLAEKLGRLFLDMDTEIERREGRPIPQIFAQNGEPYFRQLERRLVQELAARTGMVIAPGGGIVLNPDNVRDFAASGLVVNLRVSPEWVLKRVGQDPNRPLLQGGDPLPRIRELMEKRKALYAAVPHQVETDGLTPEAVGDRVLELFRQTAPAS